MLPAESLPDRVGPYRVLSRIAFNGTTTLYLGREEGPMGFARDVALKLVANPGANDREISEELAREAAVCSRLNHPGIVQMHRFFEDDPWLVLVLEFVDGSSLADLLHRLGEQKERLSDSEIAHIGVSVLDALAHAHAMRDEQGVRTPAIHRAVSLSKVLLSREGAVKLGGFGMAKILGRSPDTAIGLVKGISRYMSPEQALGQRVTEKVDVYAAALMLWELFSGQAPVGPTTKSIGAAELNLLAERKHASLGTLRKDLPRELVAMIDSALDPSPESRSITCADMSQWIRKFVPVGPGAKQLRERMSTLYPPTSRALAPPASVQQIKAAGPAKPEPNHRATLLGLAPYVSPHSGGTAAPAPAVAPAPALALAPTIPEVQPPEPAAPPVQPAPTPLSLAATMVAPPPQRHFPTPAAFPPPPYNLPGATPAATAPPVAEDLGTSPTVPPPAQGSLVLSFPPPAAAAPAFEPPLEGVVPPHVPTPRVPTPIPVRPRGLSPRQRSIAIVAGSVIACGVVVLGVLIAYHRGQSSVSRSAAGSPAPTASQARVEAVPPASAAPSAAPAIAAVPSSATAEPAAEKAPSEKGTGFLTVNSSVPGFVYVNMARVGKIGAKIELQCGSRFVSIGRPDFKGHTVWLAPSQTLQIPCGEELEVSIEPRFIRKAAPAKHADPRAFDPGKI